MPGEEATIALWHLLQYVIIIICNRIDLLPVSYINHSVRIIKISMIRFIFGKRLQFYHHRKIIRSCDFKEKTYI